MAHKLGLYTRDNMMATKEHKAFIAKINYDADIDTFFSCVVNIYRTIIFYAKNHCRT